MSAAILIDDTDTNIQYSGNWLPITATSDYDNLGNFGQPFRHTLHGTKSSAGFTYNFTGHSVLVAGTVSSVVTTSPSFTCSIDNEAFQSTPSYSGNGVTLCKVDNLSEGPHTLELNTGSSSHGGLLFDYIQYVSSSDITPTDHASAVIQHGDALLHSCFDEYWYIEPRNSSLSRVQSVGAVTRTTNSTFEFLFNGTALSWFGFYDKGYPSIKTTATYSIDYQPPIEFSLRGVSNSSQFDRIFFQIDQLPPKQHKLIVTYKGNNETTPLTLEALVIENGSIAGQQLQQLPNPSSTYTTLPTSTAQKASSLNPNAIVGGVIGGVAIVLFAVFALLLIRIRLVGRNHMAASTEFTSQHIPYPMPMDPIVRTPSMHKQKPPPARYMPPLSTAGSMRSYDPPSTAVPSIPDRRSSNRSHRRESAPKSLGSKRQTLPKVRSTKSSQNYISLNALYSQDNTGNQNPDPSPEPLTSPPPSSILK